MAGPSRVAVYCGASTRVGAPHLDFARDVGRRLAAEHITLVYGGGRIGLMGAVADGCLERGGHVLGVIPSRLSGNEVAHEGLSELIVVDSMHARKQLMVGLSDAIVALPGAFGTLDELFEAITWRQLGYHEKPVLLCDPSGYYDALLDFLARAEAEAFLRPESRALLGVTRSIDALVDALRLQCRPSPRLG